MTKIYTQTDIQEMDFLSQLHQAQTHKPTKDEQEFINAHLMLTEIVETIPTMILSYHGTPSDSDFADILGLSSNDFDIIFYGDYDGEYLRMAYAQIEHYYNDNDDLMNAIIEYYE
ncbi:hypothetical protein [Mammaliicoccus phage vB_MscM-PMS3]|nr:hypothetical protein [Mammaliicoccus phage vB_MscM-PMS3]